MDQLNIFQRMKELYEKYEAQLTKKYAELETKTLDAIRDHFEKYGNQMDESIKHNRFDKLTAYIRNIANALFGKITTLVTKAEESVLHDLYTMYIYLAHMFTRNDKVPTALKSERVKAITQFKRLHTDVPDVLHKHKSDYVYGVVQDVREKLVHEAATVVEAVNDVKKRVKATTSYGKSRLLDVVNRATNFVTDSVHSAVKPFTKSVKHWLSMRDHNVRAEHRTLDGQIADGKGYFHYAGEKAKRPKTWPSKNMNYGCRCKVILVFNGVLPKVSAVYDYQDATYKQKINARIGDYQELGFTYLQAIQKAQKDIKPPKRKIKGFLSYTEWLKKYG